ncbi:MAG: AAA family ATPase [Syntrophales bacterium]|nr:AAA family ATPase [Syntrophales bacterium]
MSRKGFTLALSGKGGVGKTMLASLLIRGLAREGYVLAIDADPDSNLPQALGMDYSKSIGDLREAVVRAPARSPVAADKAGAFERSLHELVEEGNSIDLVVMGRSEGPGCYCAIGHILRQVIDSKTENYDFTVIDCEAGLEHLSRNTTRDVDIMLVVTEPTLNGILTAKRVHELAKELNIGFGRIMVVANKVTDENRSLIEKLASEHGLSIDACLPFDPAVTCQDLNGRPMIQLSEESPVSKSVAELVKLILRLLAAEKMD